MVGYNRRSASVNLQFRLQTHAAEQQHDSANSGPLAFPHAETQACAWESECWASKRLMGEAESNLYTGSLLVTNQEAVLAQALLYNIQCAVEFLLGTVICCLQCAEARLVYSIVDLQSQTAVRSES